MKSFVGKIKCQNLTEKEKKTMNKPITIKEIKNVTTSSLKLKFIFRFFLTPSNLSALSLHIMVTPLRTCT